MLKKMTIKNLTLFSEAELHFAPGLNVIVGENGSGKSHILKIAYAIIAAGFQEGIRSGSSEAVKPIKSQMQKSYADKLVNVMRPEYLGRLARRRQGRERCALGFHFQNKNLDCRLSFATSSKSEVQIDLLNKAWQPKAPVFLPTRELLTLYPGFVPLYNSHYLEFEETYHDTCLLLGKPALRGARHKRLDNLLRPLEEGMGGTVRLDNNGRFYLSVQKQGNMEMHLVAEGLRKLAMVARLIVTGSLLDKGYLFWDEPETNLNPKLIKLLANVILHLCKNGIQVFIASHSLFLLRELEILSQDEQFAEVKQRCFSFRPDDHSVRVEQGQSIEDVQTLTVLDEELMQSDRFIEHE